MRKPSPETSPRRRWLYPLLAAFGLAAALAIGIGAHRWLTRAKVERMEPEPAATLDLLSPDAFLSTQSLSRLPQDLLAAPVLRDLATEDLFFYYREDEGRLGLEGALRRIGFEHELQLDDRVIAAILDRPARVAFWKSRDGKLGRWLLVARRDGLVPVLEALGKAALDDRQLRIAGNLLGPDGPPVYELRHGPSLKLYFASVGDHLLAFSDPAILLNPAESQREPVARLLAADAPTDLLAQGFRLGAASQVHTLAVSASYFGLGYQALFPALQALRFDYGDAGWTAAVAMSAPFPATGALWSALPDHPALCLAVPVDPGRTAALLSRLAKAEDAQRIAEAIEPPAALCWYDKAKLYTPLAVIREKPGAGLEANLRSVFKDAIGSREAGVERLASPSAQAKKPEPGVAETVVAYHPPFEVAEERGPNGTVWKREVSSRYGLRPSEDSPRSADMRSARYFTVGLAEWKGFLLFSPDAELVDDAIATLEGRYPALGDALPEGAESAVAAYPDRLATLVEAAVLDSLPGEQEAVFRANVSERLLPGLEKLKSDRIMLLPAPAGKSAWEPLEWAGPR
jgi:uncharacterized protein YfaA (DUF2138 family)